MALAGMNNMLVEGCRFDNCGWASAKCAFDAEDGWDLMQDLTFRNNIFTNNQVLATAPGFKFVTLSNPNTSAGTPAATNMWVCFAGNRFSAAGGTVLQSGAPAAGNRLLVDFHTNVYNEIGLYNATISNKSNVVITILPGLPTGLAAAFGTPAAPENGGPGSVPLTISRYRDTAGPLTVHLASSQPALLVVPASVIIPAGETSVTLWLDALDNTGQDGHQTVTVTATADGFTAGGAPVAVHDDECAGLAQVPAEAPLPLVEGETASYTLALGTVPAATVTVTLQPQAPLAAAPATLVFGPENWSQPQTVTVAHPDTDTQADPPRERLIGYLLTSDDPAYQGLAAPALTVAVADNDPPALVLTAAVVTVSEAAGGAATTVTLYRNTPATNALFVAMTSSHPDILRIDSPAMIPTGTAGITLDVDVLDDAVIEPDVPVTLSAAAAGFVEGSVVITVKDDDTPPTAITNVVPYAESFETWVAGAPLQPARGWYAGDTQSCTVVQETYAYAAPLPLDVQHTKVAALNGPVVNRIVRQTGLTWFDMMLAPTLGDLQREDLEEHDTGLLFSEEGLLRLFHRDLAGGTNRWTTLGHPAIATGAWVRISMGVDYATSDPAFPGIRFLRLFVDGQPIASGQALTDNRGGGEPGGHWFAIHPRPGAGILELGFQDGPCRLDDLVVTPRAPATPAGTAWPWLADHGLATADELSDLDRDGFTAADEYVALTDPTDAESRFMIQAVEPSASALRLGVPSAAGRLYTVERRETPGGGDWQPVPPWIDVPGTGAMLWLPATNGLPSGFFRARVRLAD